MRRLLNEMTSFVEKKRNKNTDYHAYREDELFTYNGKPQFSVLDFWRYHFSQIAEMQASISEFLVAKSLGIEKAENVNYWTAYDMSYKGRRIEVKATAYVHPFNSHISKQRTFSIAPTKNNYWQTFIGPDYRKREARQSEVYVFCINTDKDIENHNPLNIDLWRFYVVPTYKINAYSESWGQPNQKTISLRVVKSLSRGEVTFGDLRREIEYAISESDTYINEYEVAHPDWTEKETIMRCAACSYEDQRSGKHLFKVYTCPKCGKKELKGIEYAERT